MLLFSRRTRRFESVIGTLILFLLIATAVGIYILQRDVDMARFGVSSLVAGDSSAAGETSPGGGSLEPRGPSHESLFFGLSTDNFSPVGTAETYNADNLYEKIDGKAPMYVESGFNLLTTQRFVSEDNTELCLEIYLYDMGNPRNAFSVFSRQKRADGTDWPELLYAYQTSNALYVSYGKYYIEAIGFAESQKLIDVMKKIAQQLTAQLGTGDEGKIAELGFFPPQGTIAGSWKLYLNSAFGFEGLSDIFSARFQIGEGMVTVFLGRQGNAAEARTIAESYRDFLTSNGATILSAESEALKSADASVLDFYGSTEIIFTAGRFVGGVHEADEKQSAEKAAEVLLARLNKIGGLGD